jgi:hypothetical protein
MRAVVALVLVLASGCLPKLPRQRLAERAKIAVGWVVDPAYAGAAFAPPDALKQAMAKEFEDHNLEVVEVPVDVLAPQRLTDARFEVLKKAGQVSDAKFAMLVEQRVQFFSQIDGRYRWEVGTSLTASRIDGPSAKDPFEIPVILMFDHEREKEAIVYAATDVANRVGTLLDGVLAAPPPVPAATPPAQ